ncbi:MAG: hypothetical protein IPO06_02825 [Leptospiraceae bacterium]|nr:hypothetical protein [Leptospiraceae bacterium]
MNFIKELFKNKKRLMVIIYIITLGNAMSFCTFGSEGNSLTDNKIIVTRLALLRDSIKTNANLQILFYDDQGDEKLDSFQLNSGTANDLYTVTLTDSSKINFDKIELYISTTSSNITANKESQNEIFLHEADGGSGGISSATTKIYVTANGYSTSTFLKANGADEFGSYSASESFVLANLPQGILQKVTFHFASILFVGSLKSTTKTKNFTIQFPLNDISFTRLCSNTLGLNQGLNLKLDIKYSELFKDTTTNAYTIIDNTKILRAIHDLPDNNPVISNAQNSGIYNEIIKNWNLTTTIKEHRCSK